MSKILLIPLIALIFIYLELSLLISISSVIGTLGTIFLLFLSGFIGIAMLRSRGIFTLLNLRKQINQGEIPLRTLTLSIVWMIAAILFIIPGVLTDLIALCLLFPPVQRWLGKLIMSKFNLINLGFNYQSAGKGFQQQFYGDKEQSSEIFEAEYEKQTDEERWLK
ncbi:FxsA family protein [Mannheimia massilioguelmaensis]|uniref:FxsA family protein n=1 Tax=Mannheimia massilioguelmaensis TaxID=1604354 RepID=UPI0005CAA534|nr:FxsA family protein [Mannheimia massilioguelmaensis]